MKNGSCVRKDLMTTFFFKEYNRNHTRQKKYIILKPSKT